MEEYCVTISDQFEHTPLDAQFFTIKKDDLFKMIEIALENKKDILIGGIYNE